MLLHDVTNTITSQITGETKTRYLRLLNHGEKFRDSIQVVSVHLDNGIILICNGGHIQTGVSAVIEFTEEEQPISDFLNQAVNQLVDEYCAVFNAQFEHSSLNL